MPIKALSPEKFDLAKRYFREHIQTINLEEHPEVANFERFHVKKSAVRLVNDKQSYRYLLAVSSDIKSVRFKFKKDFCDRINRFKSQGQDCIFIFDNLNGPDNKKTIDLVFSEFEEHHHGWTAQELEAAKVILAEQLWQKSIIMVRGIREEGVELFIEHIEEAASNPPQLNTSETVAVALSSQHGIPGIIGREIELAAKAIHANIPSALARMTDPFTAATLNLGRTLQGPSIN